MFLIATSVQTIGFVRTHGLLKIIGRFYLKILLYNSVDLGAATINGQLKKDIWC